MCSKNVKRGETFDNILGLQTINCLDWFNRFNILSNILLKSMFALR